MFKFNSIFLNLFHLFKNLTFWLIDSRYFDLFFWKFLNPFLNIVELSFSITTVPETALSDESDLERVFVRE